MSIFFAIIKKIEGARTFVFMQSKYFAFGTFFPTQKDKRSGNKLISHVAIDFEGHSTWTK
jgi:thiamine monophosphate synthase